MSQLWFFGSIAFSFIAWAKVGSKLAVPDPGKLRGSEPSTFIYHYPLVVRVGNRICILLPAMMVYGLFCQTF